MSSNRFIHLFEGYGIEQEYMIVDRESLNIRPISDVILTELAGELTGEVELGEVAWSNELVLHVLELKTNGPKFDLMLASERAFEQIQNLNRLLAEHGSMLMGTAAHPFFDPKDMKLWPHDNSEIYECYNRIFECRGHGWSNLQSVHINLPFFDDAEFGALHAAVRVVLPLIPAVAASSPYIEGKHSGVMDRRIEFYRGNQRRIPSISGLVIPERVYSRKDYEALLASIYRDIAPFDPQGVLQEEWLNSRGAIARFDRQAIEIRVMDIQESVRADFAIVQNVIAVIKALASNYWDTSNQHTQIPEQLLLEIFLSGVKGGLSSAIESRPFLELFRIADRHLSFRDFWFRAVEELSGTEFAAPEASQKDFVWILNKGSLAERLVRVVGEQPAFQDLVEVYRGVANCLGENRFFAA